MRPLGIVGILLIVLGGIVLVRGLNMTTKREVAEVGPIEISTQETRAVPTWVGAVAAVTGIALVLGGAKRKP